MCSKVVQELPYGPDQGQRIFYWNSDAYSEVFQISQGPRTIVPLVVCGSGDRVIHVGECMQQEDERGCKNRLSYRESIHGRTRAVDHRLQQDDCIA